MLFWIQVLIHSSKSVLIGLKCVIDSKCAREALRVRTYKVMPMTPDVGLLEWVNNTEPLKSVLEDEVKIDQYGSQPNAPRVDLMASHPAARHRAAWLKKVI
jgi:hypothetical protein